MVATLPDMLSEIFLRAQGIPRLINAICDNLPLTAFALESRTCTMDMIDEVTNDMRLEWPGRRLRLRGPTTMPGEASFRQFSRGD